MALDAVMNGISTLTGSVEKAVIRIRDDRELSAKDLEESAPSAYHDSWISGLVDTSALSVANSLGDLARGALAGAMGLGSQAPPEYNKSINVQFNPSSIKINGHGGDDDVQITNYTQDGRGVSRGAANLQMDFSVNLIFDQISNTAAFQQDLLTFSSSRAIAQAGNALLNMATGLLGGGKPQSIQVVVEAFIAALRNDKTRMICFEWGELCYEGMLRQVNSTYTMFDVLGNPIRAEVGLVLYLMESSSKGIADYSNRYWFQAYKAAFINGNPLAEMAYRLAKLPPK